MNKKLLSLILATTLSITGLLAYTPIVNAKSLSYNVDSVQQRVPKDNLSQSLKIIEKDYLIKNNDGTFSIKSNAEKVVDSNTLSIIKQGMEDINKLINDKQLECQDGLNITKTSKVITNQEINRNISVLNSSGTVADLGTVIWHWYGFDVCCDAYNSQTMANILRACARDLGYGGGGVGAVVGHYASGPYGLTIVVGTQIYAYDFDKGADQCSLGAQNGNGSITYFLGAPSRAAFTHAQAIVYVN